VLTAILVVMLLAEGRWAPGGPAATSPPSTPSTADHDDTAGESR
jgi:hypothetical protein